MYTTFPSGREWIWNGVMSFGLPMDVGGAE